MAGGFSPIATRRSTSSRFRLYSVLTRCFRVNVRLVGLVLAPGWQTGPILDALRTPSAVALQADVQV